MELQASLEQERTDRLNQGMKLERKYIRQSLAMKADHERQMVDKIKELEDALDSRLSARVMGILRENKRLQADLAESQDMVAELRRRNTDLKAERAELRVDLKTTEEVKDRGDRSRVTQALELKELRGKVADAEGKIANLSRNLGEKLVLKEADGKQQTLTHAQEIRALELKLYEAESETMYIRNVAREVLRQRSEVETFLLSSIEQVKREAIAEAAEAQWGNTKQNGRTQADSANESSAAGAGENEDLGELERTMHTGNLSGLADSTGRLSSKAMDLSELSWAERERILRLLFVKMNKMLT